MLIHNASPNILVLGIGNLVMSDDGVGVRIVQRLQREYYFSGNVQVIDGGTLGLDLLPMLEDKSHLIIIDAVETGEKPGTCITLNDDEIPVALETKVSPHQMGVKDLLSVSRLLGHIPERMILFGIQPECIELGEHLSPAVAAQVDTLVECVVNQLKMFRVDVSTC